MSMQFYRLFRFFVVPISLLVVIGSSCQSSVGVLSKAHRQVPMPPEAFGAQDWKHYFGVEVDAEPPLPANIEEILDSEAPFLL